MQRQDLVNLPNHPRGSRGNERFQPSTSQSSNENGYSLFCREYVEQRKLQESNWDEKGEAALADCLEMWQGLSPIARQTYEKRAQEESKENDPPKNDVRQAGGNEGNAEIADDEEEDEGGDNDDVRGDPAVPVLVGYTMGRGFEDPIDVEIELEVLRQYEGVGVVGLGNRESTSSSSHSSNDSTF